MDWTLDLCAYEEIVNSLYSTLSKLENYTGLDLKNQMLKYILENYYHDKKIEEYPK